VDAILATPVPGDSPLDRQPTSLAVLLALLGKPGRPKYDLLLFTKIGFACLGILAQRPQAHGLCKERDMNGLGGLNKSPEGVVIGLVQLQLPVVVTKADLARQTDRIVYMVGKARRNLGTMDLVVFPEYSLHGLSMDTNPAIMCRLDGPEVAAFKKACIPWLNEYNVPGSKNIPVFQGLLPFMWVVGR
jgi:apolipoprotein N-acyltransferase